MLRRSRAMSLMRGAGTSSAIASALADNPKGTKAEHLGLALRPGLKGAETPLWFSYEPSQLLVNA
jgi:hypothetical protein